MLRSAIAGIALVGGMWCYAVLLLMPLRVWRGRRSARVTVHGGAGARFSTDAGAAEPDVHLAARHAPFDDVAADYDRCVGPFSGPIFDAALREMTPYLALGSRVLDVGCGPGAALRKVARLVPEGEVVGVDISINMLRLAHERTRRDGLANVAFVHADVAELPRSFSDSFDVAYSCLVHHHLADPLAAVRSITNVLRPGGRYGAIDATGEILTRLASPLARAVDPGWVGFPRREPLLALLRDAGLAQVSWVPLAPGIGMALGTRA